MKISLPVLLAWMAVLAGAWVFFFFFFLKKKKK